MSLPSDEYWELQSKMLETKYKQQQAEENRDWEARAHLAEQIRMLKEMMEELKGS